VTSAEINNLTIAELERIITLRAKDITVFIGTVPGKVLLTGDIHNVSLNGSMVQINLETAALDSVMENNSFQAAFGSKYDDN